MSAGVAVFSATRSRGRLAASCRPPGLDRTVTLSLLLLLLVVGCWLLVVVGVVFLLVLLVLFVCLFVGWLVGLFDVGSVATLQRVP